MMISQEILRFGIETSPKAYKKHKTIHLAGCRDLSQPHFVESSPTLEGLFTVIRPRGLEAPRELKDHLGTCAEAVIK